MQLLTSLRPLMPAAAHIQSSHKPFNVSDFLQGNLGYQVLIITQDLLSKEAARPITLAMFESLVNQITALSDCEDRAIFVEIDEATFIGRLPALEDLFIYGRSKGVRVNFAFQDWAGFTELYGENIAEEILSVSGFLTLLKTYGAKTAKFCSSLFGTEEYWETLQNPNYSSQGMGISEHKQRVQRSAVFDSAFYQLPFASPETGITAFYRSPYTGAYETIPGDVVEQLKPKKSNRPELEPKEPGEEFFTPMTDKELEQFFEMVKEWKKESKTAQKVYSEKYEPQTEEEKLRADLFDQITELLEPIIQNIRNEVLNDETD